MQKKSVKAFLIISAFCLTTTVFAQMTAESPKPSDAKKDGLSEAVRNEIKNFHEKRKAINDECKKKRDELKASLSPEARKAVEELRERKKMERKEAKEKKEHEHNKMNASTTTPQTNSTTHKN